MKSDAGRILTLIGGIFTFIGAGVTLIIGIIIFSLSGLNDKIGDSPMSLLMIGIIFIFAFFILLALGFLKIYAYNLMKNPKTTMKGGVIAIVTGAFSDLFSLIGGIIAVVDADKKN